MIKELYTAALGMIPQQMRLEISTNNLSNANTIGYKKEKLFERAIIEAKLNVLNNFGLAEYKDLPNTTYTDFSVGDFEKTDNPLDLAIENPNAFFAVEDENGNRFLTRAGNFTLNRDGSIVARDGKFLVADSGRLNILREFTINNFAVENTIASNIRITERGEVYLNQALIGRILLVEVENPETLEKVSGIYFKSTENTRMKYLDYDETNIRQGWVENSNVNPVEEMVGLIELQRLFELGAKVIQTHDQSLDQSIRIGRFV